MLEECKHPIEPQHEGPLQMGHRLGCKGDLISLKAKSRSYHCVHQLLFLDACSFWFFLPLVQVAGDGKYVTWYSYLTQQTYARFARKQKGKTQLLMSSQLLKGQNTYQKEEAG